MTGPLGLSAVDLFAGTGWGVACRWLGIDEVGVEKSVEARATREANGMRNWLDDVWEVLEAAPADSPEFRAAVLIASPPCQTFSMAGGGKGRQALEEVISLIDSRAYLDPAKLRAFGQAHDERTALVLTPLTYVAKHSPLYVVLEQVPPVLPVWQRMAVELERWGYSVVTGVLNAEQYGVPQTRKRAVLIARADGVKARMPTPTHSRYYSRDPKRLDPGVLPWVSMAEALGWGMTERPFVTAGNAVGRAEGIGGSGGKAAVVREKERGAWAPADGARYFHPMSYGRRGIWPGDEPAPTIRGVQRDMPENYKPHPRDAVDRKQWQRPDGEPLNLDPAKPATTVQGDPRLTAREHHYHGEQAKTSTRVTVAEAAALQSYPPGFDWESGPGGKPLTKTKAFLQIGNAVPPLLAEAILRTIVGGES